MQCKQKLQGFAARRLTGGSKLDLGCKTWPVSPDLDLIRQEVNHLVARLFAKADAEHADHGLEREHSIACHISSPQSVPCCRCTHKPRPLRIGPNQSGGRHSSPARYPGDASGQPRV